MNRIIGFHFTFMRISETERMPKPSVRTPTGGGADEFYKECLVLLNELKLPYLVGGTFALNAYTDMHRPTKDLDIFTKAGDYPKIVQAFRDRGFKVAVSDERWLAKISRNRHFVDIIFGAGNAIVPVTDAWFNDPRKATILDVSVPLLSPTELAWSKFFRIGRNKYEGNDIAHLILKKDSDIDWKRLFSYADQYWEVLLGHILHFRFIYPSEREKIPRWLLGELLERLTNQANMPTSKVKVCRGRVLSTSDFAIDVMEWGFADIIGMENEKSA